MKDNLEHRGIKGSIVLLAVPAFIVPVVLLGTTLDPALTSRFVLLAAALLVALPVSFNEIRINADGEHRGRTPKSIVLAFAIYLLCELLSISQAINRAESVIEILKTFLFLGAFLVATFVLRARSQNIVHLSKGISLLALAVAAIGIFQYYGLGFLWIPGSAETQPVSTFTNKNLFSSFLFLTLPFVMFGFYTFRGRWHAVTLMTTVLVIYVILLAQTRAVWVALVISSVAIAALRLLSFSTKTARLETEHGPTVRRRSVQLGVLLVAVLLFNVLGTVAVQYPSPSRMTAGEKAASIFDAQNSSRAERIMLWKKTLLMIRDHPFLGVGPGNWKILLPSYGTAGTRLESGTVHFPQPHNDFLWVAGENGIVGALSYIMIFLIAIYYCFWIHKTAANVQDKILSLSMMFGIIGYLTVSCFDFPKERIEHLVYVALILAAVVSTYGRIFPRGAKFPRGVMYGVFGVVMIMTGASVALGTIRLRSEIHTRKALAAKQVLDWDGVIREIDEAYSEWATLDPMVTPLPWYRGVARFSTNDVDGALKDFEKAYEIHPNHIHVLNNLATCYEMKGDHGRAIEFYTKVLAISPHFEESLLNLTAVYFNAGRYEDAYRTIQQCGNSHDPRAPEFLAAVKARLNIP